MMQIIPVIDLLNGVVVHAKRGERQHYQPIQSLLTSSSKPLDILAALLDIYPFQQLYIADLNAIQKFENVYTTNYRVIDNIAQRFPQLKLWIDAGISNNTELSVWQNLDTTIILGSENFTDLSSFLMLKNQQEIDSILSLDFMPNGYHGPAELLTNTQYWSQNVIVMSLANVGANQGVNDELLAQILQRAIGKNIYAAGGVRNLGDLIKLKEMAIHGALIATALHQKQITYEQLKSLSQ